MNDIYHVEYIRRGAHDCAMWTPEQMNLIKKLYCDQKLTTTAIGKRFGVRYMAICRVLGTLGINRRHNAMRRYSLNETYFDVIDSHNKAYILGFLYADGSNNPKKGTISMSLQEKDRDILQRIREQVGSEKPLEYLDYSDKHDFGYNYKNQYRLLFFSSHMCEKLNEIGMVQNKSLILKFPKMSDEFLRSFLRGYFDGDGSFSYRWNQNNTASGTIGITSTQDFCISAEQIIYEQLGIHGRITDASNCNGITKVLIYSANKCKNVLDWFYKDAELYLKRKYDRYLNAYYIKDTSITCQRKVTNCAS